MGRGVRLKQWQLKRESRLLDGLTARAIPVASKALPAMVKVGAPSATGATCRRVFLILHTKLML